MIKAKPKKKAFIPYDPLKAKSYAERVKALLIERGTINVDICQVCDEAKEDGCEPALIRYVARELMIDDDVRKERDEKRARYLHAVGLAVEAVKSGEMSARQAAKVYSIGKSSVYKGLSVRDVSADREMIAADFELHDADGVITETGGKNDERSDQVSVAAEHHKGSGEGGDGGLVGSPVAEAEEGRADAGRNGADDESGRESSSLVPVLEEAPATPSVGAVAPPEDDLAFPDFLVRKKAEGPLAGGEQGRAQRAHP